MSALSPQRKMPLKFVWSMKMILSCFPSSPLRAGCYVKCSACNHDKIKPQLNELGDYVVFPSLWWHHAYCDIAANTSDDHAIFTAQFFATPRLDISSKTSQMTSHIMSNFDPTKLDSLTKDLLLHWEDPLLQSILEKLTNPRTPTSFVIKSTSYQRLRHLSWIS